MAETVTSAKIRTKDVQLDEITTSFADLQLSKQVLAGLKSASFFQPSPVQLKAIPLGKIGLDLIVQAKSGTGKTCVFTVIALEHLLLTASSSLQVLMLAPTREVALQICTVIQGIGKGMKIKVNTFIGGTSVKEDKAKLKTCQIAVGTPGRILHLMAENLLPTSNIRMFVLDEADKLLAPEFQETINLVYSKLPENKQMLVLSATYPDYMAIYVTRYMRDATFVRLNKVDPSLRGIRQYFKVTPHSDLPNVAFDAKVSELIKLLGTTNFQQAIVFINYQLKAENLCNSLTAKGWPAVFISGNIDQSERNQAINQLKSFKCRILVSTDLTARGIDAENVDLIVCMDLASDPETYLHRIGRAGRYGSQGTAVSYVCERDEASLFETIIDSYNLRITQFESSLDDVVTVRNASDEKARIDDVTIEKVQLTKAQLDQSLFEYEQSRNKAIHSRYRKEQKRSDLTDSTFLNELMVLPNMCQYLEEDFKKFDYIEDIENLKRIQESYAEISSKKGVKLSLKEVKMLTGKFKNDMAVKLKINQIEAAASGDLENALEKLNGISDWKSVEKIEEKCPVETDKNILYSYYYSYYFKNFLRQITD